jgi:hypothetical protein
MRAGVRQLLTLEPDLRAAAQLGQPPANAEDFE